ncbi:hypothetical protein B0H13DRAFT_2305641 [Mycena leptocephala]|nr:hypothetical protein B0H13DRAFT_2305641 [Mycena leptocephala]
MNLGTSFWSFHTPFAVVPAFVNAARTPVRVAPVYAAHLCLTSQYDVQPHAVALVSNAHLLVLSIAAVMDIVILDLTTSNAFDERLALVEAQDNICLTALTNVSHSSSPRTTLTQ